MAVPGWYPDPRGGPGLRFWDGAGWTDHTQPYPQGQPSGQPPPAPEEPAARSNAPLWIALGVAVALIIGVGSWLLFFRDPTPGTTPLPTATAETTEPVPTTADPDPTTSEPAPTTSEADPTTGEARTSAPGTTAPEPAATPLVAVGEVLPPLECEGNAADAVGQPGTDGRFRSAAGLSFPPVAGFTATPIQYPWVHGSNSQAKDYGNNWMATLTVGELLPEEGFSGHQEAAIRFTQCLLGSGFYGDFLEQATVYSIDNNTEQRSTWFEVDVDITGMDDVARDWVTVVTYEREDALHIAVGIVPDSSQADNDLVVKSISEVTFS